MEGKHYAVMHHNYTHHNSPLPQHTHTNTHTQQTYNIYTHPCTLINMKSTQVWYDKTIKFSLKI